MTVVQVGAYPPPYGGVTVHLMRLHEHLRARGRTTTLFDLSGEPKTVPDVRAATWLATLEWLETAPRSIVHFHNFTPGAAAAFRRVARKHVVVLSLHDDRFGEELEAAWPVRALLARRALRRLHCMIVSNRRAETLARRLFGRRLDLRVIPEFIPPVVVPPLSHPALLALRRQHRYLLASNAWRISFHHGEDLYGLDLLVESLHSLVIERGLDVGLAVLLPSVGDENYLALLRRRAQAWGIADRLLFVTEPVAEAASLWREADVVVRATNTDGSSLTVLEALALGVPVVASDCVERPEGTLLFRTRDSTGLTTALAEVLADLPTRREGLLAQSRVGSAERFLALYDELEARWTAHAA